MKFVQVQQCSGPGSESGNGPEVYRKWIGSGLEYLLEKLLGPEDAEVQHGEPKGPGFDI